jgi:predicted PurR-regulated permease PerM
MAAECSALKTPLAILLVFVSATLVWVLLPFYGTILWAFIIALLFAPLFRFLLRSIGARSGICAAITVALVFVMVVLPLVLIAASLANEISVFVSNVQSGQIKPAKYFQEIFDALPAWASQLLDRFGLINFATLQKRLSDLLAQASQTIAKQALSIGQITFEFMASVFVTLYLAFFFIRDGEKIAAIVRQFLPLDAKDNQELVAKFNAVVRATVKGNILVAGIQGMLGGIAFWALDLTGALLWGVLMAFLSLVPAVGAALIWVPVAIYFFAIGEIWHSVMLIAWGVLVIGLVDNLLRPLLVGRDTRMPDYVVLLSTLGGLATFGINGFILGPLSAAMFIAVWHIQLGQTALPAHPDSSKEL